MVLLWCLCTLNFFNVATRKLNINYVSRILFLLDSASLRLLGPDYVIIKNMSDVMREIDCRVYSPMIPS